MEISSSLLQPNVWRICGSDEFPVARVNIGICALFRKAGRPERTNCFISFFMSANILIEHYIARKYQETEITKLIDFSQYKYPILELS